MVVVSVVVVVVVAFHGKGLLLGEFLLEWLFFQRSTQLPTIGLGKKLQQLSPLLLHIIEIRWMLQNIPNGDDGPDVVGCARAR